MRNVVSLPVVLALFAPGLHAQFGPPVATPGPVGDSENIDAADVDLDGDWDLAVARGGDFPAQQNRLWINAGGLQGGVVGELIDETAARFPSVLNPTRDVEFADIDDDGDPDLYLTAHSSITNAGARWWVNQGGEQAGQVGFYVDETAQRWVGLGQPGSSITPVLLLNGTFIDWTSDGDFADLDNDGDLDLVHSSYGGAYGGNVPTRMFLNDGTGRFEEFNPSGFQLSGTNMTNGDPALWAQGVHQSNTDDVSGAEADIASSTVDFDLGDLDGDFDIDLLMGSRDLFPRLFLNGLEETGSLLFRDVTGGAFPPSYASGGGQYEQELGDLDGDDDLDIYGLNWSGFNDRTFANDGSANFDFLQSTVPNSGADEEEADFIDFDADGDLDVILANFSGLGRLYENDGSGLLSLAQTIDDETFVGVDRDVEAVDLDADGDTDAVFADRGLTLDRIHFNETQVPDTHGPRIPLVENLGDRTAAQGRFPVRAQVYDNASYYITWYNTTRISVDVDGFNVGSEFAKSSYGQIFRGELPANLVGGVSYRFRSLDEYGNEGVSSDETYTATTPLAFDAPFGSSTPGGSGTPALDSLSVPFLDSTYWLGADGFTSGALTVTYVATQALGAPLVLPGIGTEIWIAGLTVTSVAQVADADGRVVAALPIPSGAPAGLTLHAQTFGTDGAGGNLLSATAGLSFTTQ